MCPSRPEPHFVIDTEGSTASTNAISQDKIIIILSDALLSLVDILSPHPNLLFFLQNIDQ